MLIFTNDGNLNRIVVHPCATKTETECFPCLAIEVFQKGEKSLKTWIDLQKLGKNFQSLDAAVEAARQITVVSVNQNGDVKWEQNPNFVSLKSTTEE